MLSKFKTDHQNAIKKFSKAFSTAIFIFTYTTTITDLYHISVYICIYLLTSVSLCDTLFFSLSMDLCTSDLSIII